MKPVGAVPAIERRSVMRRNPQPNPVVLVVSVAALLIVCALSCDSTDRPTTTAAVPETQVSAGKDYVLRAIGRDPASLRLVHSREPIRDVYIDLEDGWRSIAGSKITESQVAYYIGEDLQSRVANEVRGPIGDWDFDLRWRVGDEASVNTALKQYGLEIVPAPTATTRPATDSAK